MLHSSPPPVFELVKQKFFRNVKTIKAENFSPKTMLAGFNSYS